MSTQLYSVILTDLGSYRIPVAADSADEACAIVKTVLHEEVTTLPAGTTLVDRKVDAVAEVATEQPVRRFHVEGIYRLNFSVTVPASTGIEAEQYVRRLYEHNCGPFEFEHDGGDCIRLRAEEVVS